MGAIDNLDGIATRLNLRLANQIGALADVPPIADLQESPYRMVLLAIGIDRVLDEFGCASNGRSVDIAIMRSLCLFVRKILSKKLATARRTQTPLSGKFIIWASGQARAFRRCGV